MASPIHKNSLAQEDRKSFIQPALPALSLISKTGSHYGAAGRQEMNVSRDLDKEQAVASSVPSANSESGSRSGPKTDDMSEQVCDIKIDESSSVPQEMLSTQSDAQSLPESTASELPLSNGTDIENHVTMPALEENPMSSRETEDSDKPTSEEDTLVSEGLGLDEDDTLSTHEPDSVNWSDTARSDRGDIGVLNLDGLGLDQNNSSHETNPNPHHTTNGIIPPLAFPYRSRPGINHIMDTNFSIGGGLTLPSYPYQPAFTPFVADSAVEQTSAALIPSVYEMVRTLGETKEWSDWMIQINPRGTEPFISYSHGIFLVRSERLKALMNRPQNTAFGGGVITLTPARPIQSSAFEAALKYLYTDNVIARAHIPAGDPSVGIHPGRHYQVEYIVSYWISGIELGLDAVVTQAARLFGDLVDWDLIEEMAREASYLSKITRTEEIEPALASAYTAAAVSVLNVVNTFLAKNMDIRRFQLDSTTSPRHMSPRLPQLDNGRPRANPALAGLVFGSLPSAALANQNNTFAPHGPGNSAADTIASIIMLSLDFYDFRMFCRDFINAHGARASQIIAAVVEERELQRHRIVHSRAELRNCRRLDRETWDLCGLQEIFDGRTLRRERVARY